MPVSRFSLAAKYWFSSLNTIYFSAIQVDKLETSESLRKEEEQATETQPIVYGNRIIIILLYNILLILELKPLVWFRNAPADADGRPQRTSGPAAGVRLWLPGACRLRSTSGSAGLRLWHVKTPPLPSVHLQAPSTSFSPSSCPRLLPAAGGWSW